MKLYQRKKVSEAVCAAAWKFVARCMDARRQKLALYYYRRPPYPVQPVKRPLGVRTLYQKVVPKPLPQLKPMPLPPPTLLKPVMLCLFNPFRLNIPKIPLSNISKNTLNAGNKIIIVSAYKSAGTGPSEHNIIAN